MGTLRVLLALSVVLAHVGGLFRYQMAGGVIAVEMFFMISGFFMALILSEKYHPIYDKATFYANRSLRIYIPYFVVLLFSLSIAVITLYKNQTGPLAVMVSNEKALSLWNVIAIITSWFTIVGQDVALFAKLGPNGLLWSGGLPDPAVWKMMPVPPAWTVSLELVFYLIAPHLVRLCTVRLVVLLGFCLSLRSTAYLFDYDSDPWTYRFFPFELPLFILGIIAYRLGTCLNFTFRTRILISTTGILAVISWQAIAMIGKRLGLPPQIIPWGLYAYATILIPVLFSVSSRVSWDKSVANYSYALYLVHWPIIALADAEVVFWGPTSRALICIILSCVAAWALATFVEAPLEKVRQQIAKRHLAKVNVSDPIGALPSQFQKVP